MANYPKAFTDWFSGIVNPQIEGGLSDRKKEDDPGGLTFRGLTFKNFQVYASDVGLKPTLDDFKKLTTDQLKTIYYKRYWLANKVANALPKYQIVVMDSFFHGGGLKSLGYASIDVLNKSGATVADLLKNRENYFKKLDNYDSNKNGWAKRLNTLAKLSAQFAPAIVFPFFLVILLLLLFIFKF